MTQKKDIRYRKESHGVYVVYVHGERFEYGNSRDAKRFYKFCCARFKSAA
jgi:hypothetical protein